MKRAGSVWERYGSSSEGMRELVERELREMPAMELIVEAEAAGITLSIEGGQLRVRGPRNAQALGRLLLERKAEVLAALRGASGPTACGMSAESSSGEMTPPEAHASSGATAESNAGRLEDALRRHDWFYHFSDSAGTRKRGEESERRLLEMAARVPPAVVRSLWQRYYPAGQPASPRCPIGEIEEQMGVSREGGVEPSRSWDAARAAALIAEVEARIDAALLRRSIAGSSARQNVLANERAIVRNLAQKEDPHLWNWPQALDGLLARWKEWNAARSI